MMKETWILWDFNGTLLDDAAFNLSVLNRMLAARGLPEQTMESYRDTFCFPVRTFYRHVGLDAEPEAFDQLAAEYMAHYRAGQHRLRLRAGAQSALDAFRKAGYRQVLLSASSSEHLRLLLSEHAIEAYFETVLGLTDIRAAGKADIACAWARSVRKKSDRHMNLILIGDTVHDQEVARTLGGISESVSCVLVAGGHNSKARLEQTGAAVVDSLENAVQLIQEEAI